MAAKSPKTILALDVGDARIGVAIGNTLARMPKPLAVLDNDSRIFDKLTMLEAEHRVDTIVVGLPRNLDGEETQQSKAIRAFAQRLKNKTGAEIVFADESLSTKRAEDYAKQHKRPSGPLDDIAACFILEEYLGRKNG